jgi:hypothetical protein
MDSPVRAAIGLQRAGTLAHDPAKCERFADKIVRQNQFISTRSDAKPVTTFADRALT